MKIEHIKVGNTLMFPQGHNVKVLAVDPANNKVSFAQIPQNENDWIDLVSTYPVPLTHEVLISCGFVKKDGFYDLKIQRDLTFTSFGCPEGSVQPVNEENEPITNMVISELHQLQNSIEDLQYQFEGTIVAASLQLYPLAMAEIALDVELADRNVVKTSRKDHLSKLEAIFNFQHEDQTSLNLKGKKCNIVKDGFGTYIFFNFK